MQQAAQPRRTEGLASPGVDELKLKVRFGVTVETLDDQVHPYLAALKFGECRCAWRFMSIDRASQGRVLMIFVRFRS